MLNIIYGWDNGSTLVLSRGVTSQQKSVTSVIPRQGIITWCYESARVQPQLQFHGKKFRLQNIHSSQVFSC